VVTFAERRIERPGTNVGETWSPSERPLWRWDLVVGEGTRCLFHPIRDAPVEGGSWAALENGWKVTPYTGGQICVQLYNSEGVVVSLDGDVGK
jgi:hypothetical protein